MTLAVFTTIHDQDAANTLARAAINARLAACVHIEEIQSVFRWDNAVQDEPELRLLFKTTNDQYDALADLIRKDHPYDQPALWAVEMAKIDPSFANWIAAET